MALFLFLTIVLAIWTVQAGIGAHRANMREMRRDMPALFSRDNAVLVWLGF